MSDKTINDLIQKIRAFAKERDWDQYHSPKNLAMALSAETGELLEIFQWLTEEESFNLSKKKLIEVTQEIGDIQIYLLRLADQLGVDVFKAAKDKLAINKKKYPVEKSRGSARKYNEFDG